MRIAVISDIHCNLTALRLAAEDIKNQRVDLVFFLGDYITDGDSCDEVLKIVRQVADYAILGNREKYILDYTPDRKEYLNYKPIAAAYESLSKENVDYIKSLKEADFLELNGYKVLLLHGEGNSYAEEDLEATFDRFIAQYDFDICLFGHSHRYVARKYRDKWFVNPGSIGQPADGATYKYCILELSGDIKVYLKEFEIGTSFENFCAEYKNSNYYKENLVWGNLYLKSLRDGKDYFSPFIQLLNERVCDDLAADEFNKIWNQTYLEFERIIDGTPNHSHSNHN